MDIYEHAKQILFTTDLNVKLQHIDLDLGQRQHGGIHKPDLPGRLLKHEFTEGKKKFPKAGSLHLDNKKAQALHFFANHELQAIEMMAAAILLFPSKTNEDHEFNLGLMRTIQDERKHFLLYQNRFNELGYEFGDFGVGNFFWKQLPNINTKSQFYSFIALTLEAANLDFAKYYSEVFASFGDTKSSKILDIVYEDEIRHVDIGRKWLELWRGEKTLWKYYMENLPGLMTPARSKGMKFDREGRERAGLDHDFIDQVMNYRDDFPVTDRKKWK